MISQMLYLAHTSMFDELLRVDSIVYDITKLGRTVQLIDLDRPRAAASVKKGLKKCTLIRVKLFAFVIIISQSETELQTLRKWVQRTRLMLFYQHFKLVT